MLKNSQLFETGQSHLGNGGPKNQQGWFQNPGSRGPEKNGRDGADSRKRRATTASRDKIVDKLNTVVSKQMLL